ncbi:carbohydrate kinase family protein [Patescibacteria group bacterium]|nr:MAG: carbohydrate kinase family protein [Patescibacteria group bacterium]
MFDIVTVGSGTRDVFLLSDQFQMIRSPKFATGIGECVSLGSKIEVESVIHTTGGGATNAAATFARLGYNAAVVCRVGDDSAGRDVIIDLQREGIGTTLIRRVAGEDTGYSVLLTDTGTGERSVLVYRGVSGSFTAKDIPWDECAARAFYLSSLGGNLAVARRLVSHAAQCQALIAWNPGSRELKKGLGSIQDFLPEVSVFMVNREEAMMLTGKKEISGMFERLVTADNVVIITDGERGSYAARAGKAWYAPAAGSKAVSRTGAGDAFGSGFMASFVQERDVPAALALGTLNADSVIRQVGAKSGILRRWPTAAQMKKIKVKAL